MYSPINAVITSPQLNDILQYNSVTGLWENGPGIGLVRVLSATTGIDGKTVATTNLYTVPAGKKAVVTGAIIILTAKSGGSPPTVFPEVGIGVAAGEDDIFSQTKLIGLDALTEQYHFNASAIKKIADAAEIIKLGVDVGSVSTTYTMSVYLLGYEI